MTSPEPSEPFCPGFSKRARRIVELAHAEALQNASRVDDKHILVGLLAEGGSEAARMLNTRGFSLADVRSQVSPHSAKQIARHVAPFTPSAHKAVQLAQEESALRHAEVSAEHILLGLLRNGGTATHLLESSEHELVSLETELVAVLDGADQ